MARNEKAGMVELKRKLFGLKILLVILNRFEISGKMGFSSAIQPQKNPRVRAPKKSRKQRKTRSKVKAQKKNKKKQAGWGVTLLQGKSATRRARHALLLADKVAQLAPFARALQF
jgi:hypothetical protein